MRIRCRAAPTAASRCPVRSKATEWTAPPAASSLMRCPLADPDADGAVAAGPGGGLAIPDARQPSFAAPGLAAWRTVPAAKSHTTASPVSWPESAERPTAIRHAPFSRNAIDAIRPVKPEKVRRTRPAAGAWARKTASRIAILPSWLVARWRRSGENARRAPSI